MQVMRERGGCDAYPLLQTANRQASIACADKGTINPKAGRVPQGFELFCRLFDVHGNTLPPGLLLVNPYFYDCRN